MLKGLLSKNSVKGLIEGLIAAVMHAVMRYLFQADLESSTLGRRNERYSAMS